MASRPRILCLGCHDMPARAEAERLSVLGYHVESDADLGPVRPARSHPLLAAPAMTSHDLVVVWDDASLLAEVVRVFPWRIVFRTQGETARVCDSLWQSYVRPLVESRGNLRVVFANPEDQSREDPWIASVSRWTPQTAGGLPEDQSGTWRFETDEPRPVSILVPADGSNPESARARSFVRDAFSSAGFAPLVDTVDPALPETSEILRNSAGLLHPYVGDWRMPQATIAMLLLGGPVVYFEGSIVSRRVGAGGPGEAKTVEQAKELCARLRSGDTRLAESMVRAQRLVQAHYGAELVWAGFDRTFDQLIAETGVVVAPGGGTVVEDPGLREAAELADRLIEALDGDIGGNAAMRHRVLRSFYRVLLERGPDEGGFDHHDSMLQQHGRIELVLSDFLHSEEMRSKWSESRLRRWLYPADHRSLR